MNKFRIFIFFIVLLSIQVLLTIPNKVYAHPVDQTSVELYIGQDWNNQAIGVQNMKGVHTLNWIEATVILDIEDKNSILPEQLPDYIEQYKVYLHENLRIINNSDPCELTNINVPEQSRANITVLGLFIAFDVECRSTVDLLHIEETSFIDEYPTQVNYISLYSGPGVLIRQESLNKSNTTFEYDLDPQKEYTVENVDESSSTSSSETSSNAPTQSYTNSSQLQQADKLLQKVTDLLDESSPMVIVTLLTVTMLIGLLHTLEAGHSKIVLASMMIHNKMDMKKGFWYVVVFTLTHMADIIIIGIVLLAVNSFVDIFKYVSQIQMIANWALLGVGLYMFFKALSEVLHHRLAHAHHHEHHHHHDHSHPVKGQSLKEQLTVAFITGLAPCLMGWSIFLLILAAGKVYLILPAVISFGLGIFLGLLLVMVLTIKLKSLVQSKIDWIGEYSPLISAVILIAVAIILIA